jgi:hypothetical protein
MIDVWRYLIFGGLGLMGGLAVAYVSRAAGMT